jgi:hypothetical protein
VKNVLNRTYIASGNNTFTGALRTPGFFMANTATGSIYPGSPRAFRGGVRAKF